MVVTDLDGTLLDSSSRLSDANRLALERLAERGVVRVVATGRSLYSVARACSLDFPIDYLAFSTGAGIMHWRERELLVSYRMSEDHVRHAVEVAIAAGLDFMLQHAIPDNHHFHFYRGDALNPDFDRRRERYPEFALPWSGEIPQGVPVSQLLVIEAPGVPSRYEWLKAQLGGLNVVLTTSPLDHASRWIEIFPPTVSKSRAAEWLRRRHRLRLERVAAVGNDYNDTDMLDWAGQSFVVSNAVAELKARHTVVGSNDDDGFAHAVTLMRLD